VTLSPGATVGILGGGQLGRMLAMAAHRLGLHAHVFAQDCREPAVQATDRVTLAPFEDGAALDAFAAAVDVVTLEFENVPVPAVRRLAAHVPVRPGARVLEVAQDRLLEKRFARSLGLETAPFMAYGGPDDTPELAEFAFPARLKTRRLGYDGKGQVRVERADAVAAAWSALGSVPCILETELRFRRELSVLVARRPSGELQTFPLVENTHADGILRETRAPAKVDPAMAAAGLDVATRLAQGLDLEGLLAVELFETADGTLAVNELAPRPHNSGHWTLDACAVDQFEQALRAVCDWPLAPPRVLVPARMVNLIGDDANDWRRWLATPGACLHLYGKHEVRAGRKMGHVTVLDDRR
jgi:5-(carboxyamino)imidazole ribonucleotide synthase